MISGVPSDEPVSLMTQQLMWSTIEARQRPMFTASFRTIIFRHRSLARPTAVNADLSEAIENELRCWIGGCRGIKPRKRSDGRVWDHRPIQGLRRLWADHGCSRNQVRCTELGRFAG